MKAVRKMFHGSAFLGFWNRRDNLPICQGSRPSNQPKMCETRTEMTRCPWAKTEQYVLYHDAEWGVPVQDDRLLFEFLVLEGAQAGLSWETILKKRDNYRAAFDQFEPALVAKYGQKK